jgi:hypothetical protein
MLISVSLKKLQRVQEIPWFENSRLFCWCWRYKRALRGIHNTSGISWSSLSVHRFNSENSLLQKYVSFSHEKSSALLVEKVLFFLSVLLIGFSTWDHFSSAFPKNQCSCSPQRFASFIRFRSKVLWVEFWSTGKGDCCCTCWTDIFLHHSTWIEWGWKQAENIVFQLMCDGFWQ